jgi:hypothetical protein
MVPSRSFLTADVPSSTRSSEEQAATLPMVSGPRAFALSSLCYPATRKGRGPFQDPALVGAKPGRREV